ncbi:O-antigen ligase family protein [Belnapia sp. T6]|uniref:O-antigen ligase family protein n=1 Tax=Belnapia mucosa TaxID=2804532 RepID=A0ABS1VBS1_9PROT|nr:O-antigen ligase family protein [Belnapia mucosa]MBL6459072.1 O-antigen ligase family protein [Belnapia mucosa]
MTGPVARQVGTIALGSLCLVMAGVALLMLNEPRGPLLLIGLACGATASLVLLAQPILALELALMLRLLPNGLYAPELDLLFTIVVNGLLALALGAWVLRALSRREPVIWNPTCVLLGCHIAWCAVTVAWAADPVAARRSLVAYSAGWLLLFLLTNEVRTVRSLDSVMRALRLVGWIMIGGGLYAALFSTFEFGERLKVHNVNENQYGVILIAMLPGVIWPVLRRSGTGYTHYLGLSVIFIVSMLVLVALTGSRGSSLSLLLVLFLFWFWKPVRPWGIVGSVLLCGLAAVAPFVLDSVMTRFETGDLGGRGAIWQASFRILQEVLWTGVGTGNGPARLNAYIAAVTSDFRYRVDLPSHNPFLEVGLDTGLLGILLYGATVVSAVLQFVAARGRLAAAGQGLAGYYPLVLVAAIGYFTVWIKGGGLQSDLTFFTILALLIMPSQLGPAPAAAPRTPTPSGKARKDPWEPGRHPAAIPPARPPASAWPAVAGHGLPGLGRTAARRRPSR